MSHEWWVFLGLFLLGMGLLFFLKKMFPVPQEEKDLAGSWQELEKRYRKWDVLGGLLGVLFGAAGGYGSWWVCRALCSWRAQGLEGVHVLVPHAGMCLTPVVPAAIATGIAGAWILLQVLLKSRFHELAAYGSLKLGIHTTRLLGGDVFPLCSTDRGRYRPAGEYVYGTFGSKADIQRVLWHERAGLFLCRHRVYSANL